MANEVLLGVFLVVTWQFLRGVEGEGSDGEEDEGEFVVDRRGAAAEEDGAGGSGVEVGGDGAGLRRGGDEEHLALVDPGGGELLRLEEEVSVLVGFLHLHQRFLRVVALQLHHSS